MRRTMRRLWYVLRQRRFDADLAEEMACHREMAEQELARLGAAPADARLGAGASELRGSFNRNESFPIELREYLV